MGGEYMVVKVDVKPVTPVYTGDAFGINAIKPQSIMGSLRFWFEVFLKAVGYLHSGYDYKKDKLSLKEYNNQVLTNVKKIIHYKR